MKFNWNQVGMPAALVSRLGQGKEKCRRPESEGPAMVTPEDIMASREPESTVNAQAEWEEWERRFQSLCLPQEPERKV